MFFLCVCVNPTNHCLPLISLRIQDAAACQRDCFLSVFHLNPWLSVLPSTFILFSFVNCVFGHPLMPHRPSLKHIFPIITTTSLQHWEFHTSLLHFFPLYISFSVQVSTAFIMRQKINTALILLTNQKDYKPKVANIKRHQAYSKSKSVCFRSTFQDSSLLMWITKPSLHNCCTLIRWKT